ncbi:MAG TPA: 1,4-beta-xylanase [Planctomycetota bacterium]|jgi:hypothetical protein
MSAENEVWPVEKANAWLQENGFRAGCNFSPSTAINQLEMWQAETFDPATIDKELGFAEGLGFNAMRVFLHSIPWDQDKDGFLKRINQYLEIADKHKIKTLFVLFDSCWDPFPKAGKQREPKPHLHNSGWVQCPGLEILKDPARHDSLKGFVQGVIGALKSDKRVLGWDLFNEPDNRNNPAYVKFEPENKPALALTLITKAFAWAREIKPEQPLTAAPWMGPWADANKLSAIDKFMFENSDVISFHCYGNLDEMKRCVTNLRRYNRPIICSEYMCRATGSKFDPHLGYMKDEKVAAINWGLVSGKTQTIYPWDSWTKQYTAEPPLWFHDVLRPDGSLFDPKEGEYIRKVMGKQ